MGVPDRPSPGKHGSAGSAGGQGQPRDGVPPILRCIPAFCNSLAPASPTQSIKVEEEKEEDTEKEHGIVFFTLHLREMFISPPKKIRPHPFPTHSFPSVVDLSPTVFRDEPFKKTETFQEEDDLKPCFPF